MPKVRTYSGFSPVLRERLAARAEASRAQTRLPGIDALRLVAALAVVGYHGLFRGPHSDWGGGVRFPGIEDYAVYGRLGVDLFFVISGYVIAWSSEGRDAVAFARARLLRLWPAFLFCMTVSALVQALAHDPNFPVTFSAWLANLVFAPLAFHQPFVDGAYWTIVAEITFYAWVFVGIGTGLYPRHIVRLGAGWLAIAIVNNLLLHAHSLDHLFVTPYAGEFLGGMLIYRVGRGERSRGMVGLLAASVVVAVVFGDAMDIREFQWTLHYAMNPWIISGLILAAFALVAVASCIRLGRRATEIAIAAGGLTYPVYLLHQNIEYVASARLVALGVPPLDAFLGTVAALLLAAYLVFSRVEPWGKRWLARAIDPAFAVLRKLPALGNKAVSARGDFVLARARPPVEPETFDRRDRIDLAMRRRTI